MEVLENYHNTQQIIWLIGLYDYIWFIRAIFFYWVTLESQTMIPPLPATGHTFFVLFLDNFYSRKSFKKHNRNSSLGFSVSLWGRLVKWSLNSSHDWVVCTLYIYTKHIIWCPRVTFNNLWPPCAKTKYLPQKLKKVLASILRNQSDATSYRTYLTMA